MEITVKCAECGKDLDETGAEKTGWDNLILSVNPCPDCLAGAKDEGYDDGHGKGYDEGYDSGYSAGQDAPRED